MTEKPFACNVVGCEMTFANEDHLNWHLKRHDMVLNLGQANKSAEVSDQTPTPTRFIRNCEEVGLFQDLQNVNPFDETFKKAVECSKTGSLHVPQTCNNDDTLHTPHIFPHVEANVEKYVDRGNDNQSSQSTDFCISNVPTIQNDENEDDPIETIDLTIVRNESEKISERISADNNNRSKNHNTNLKNKLKESIKNKTKSSPSCCVITPVPFYKLKSVELATGKSSSSNDTSKKQHSSDGGGEREKIREMNRAAQLRCRKRKQVQWYKMEEEIKLLKTDNNKLSLENQAFKQKFYELKKLLLNSRQDKNHNAPFLKKIEDILNSAGKNPKKHKTSGLKIAPNVNKQRTIQRNVQPLPASWTVANTHPPPAQDPVVIHVLGPVAQLALSILPHKT